MLICRHSVLVYDLSPIVQKMSPIIVLIFIKSLIRDSIPLRGSSGKPIIIRMRLYHKNGIYVGVCFCDKSDFNSVKTLLKTLLSQKRSSIRVSAHIFVRSGTLDTMDIHSTQGDRAVARIIIYINDNL